MTRERINNRLIINNCANEIICLTKAISTKARRAAILTKVGITYLEKNLELSNELNEYVSSLQGLALDINNLDLALQKKATRLEKLVLH